MSGVTPGQRNGGATGRALVLHPHVKGGGGPERTERTPEACLEEACGLAAAIGLQIAHREVVVLNRLRPATLFGTGRLDALGQLIAAEQVDVVVIDGAVSPVQQRNLERAWKTKVIDRTGLILEIFGDRARTREGRLQVDLAHLSYQRSRLVRSWTHLERQRGGAGFMGGPGEAQIELDRRLIDDRITRLKRALETVTRTRNLHRAKRRKVPYPVVALVGYTNAGKSTLFNRLTRAEVFAEDLLFATLDPTMRAVDLPGGRRIILSDTVGFVSDLPTHLVAAFRATLEEVLEADIILHVRDIAHPDTEAQAADVRAVLRDLGIAEADEGRVIEVFNKIDLLDDEERRQVQNRAARNGAAVALSAATGDGGAALLDLLGDRLNAEREFLEVTVDLADGAALAWLYRHGEVISRTDGDATARLTVGLDPIDVGRFRKLGHAMRVVPAARTADPSSAERRP